MHAAAALVGEVVSSSRLRTGAQSAQTSACTEAMTRAPTACLWRTACVRGSRGLRRSSLLASAPSTTSQAGQRQIVFALRDGCGHPCVCSCACVI